MARLGVRTRLSADSLFVRESHIAINCHGPGVMDASSFF